MHVQTTYSPRGREQEEALNHPKKSFKKCTLRTVRTVRISESSPDRVAHKLQQYVLYALWMMGCLLSIVGSC